MYILIQLTFTQSVSRAEHLLCSSLLCSTLLGSATVFTFSLTSSSAPFHPFLPVLSILPYPTPLIPSHVGDFIGDTMPNSICIVAMDWSCSSTGGEGEGWLKLLDLDKVCLCLCLSVHVYVYVRVPILTMKHLNQQCADFIYLCLPHHSLFSSPFLFFPSLSSLL